MKILVTGAAGFIGFHLTLALLERNDEVVGVDSLNDYYDPALKQLRLANFHIFRFKILVFPENVVFSKIPNIY